MKTIVSLLLIGYGLIGPANSPYPPKKSSAPVPSSIVFNREVVQQINGEDGKQTITYYFSINGDYAAMKPDMKNGGSEMSLMVYASDGSTLMFNDKEKTITVMRAPKVVAEGAEMSKELAERLSHKKVAQASKKDELKVTPTGKTKNICGYTAVEYEMKNEGGKSLWYYAKVDFNPIKIYTMGAGSASTAGAIDPKKAEKLKNNPLAIPVLNKNFLLAETFAGGTKGIETKSITKKNIVISTAGYKVRDYSHKTIAEMIKAHSKGQ